MIFDYDFHADSEDAACETALQRAKVGIKSQIAPLLVS